jgi:ABC-type sugar transport system ATPase subunit
VIVGFRPEGAQVTSDGPLSAEVYATDLHGAHTMLHVNLNGDLIVHIRASRGINYPIGMPVRFDLVPEMVRFFDPRTEATIRREVRQ